MSKVLMFQDYFYQGGIEKVILDIKKNIDDNYNIDILTMVNKSNENVISLLDKDYRNFLKRFIFGRKKYKQYLKNNKYDIIHIHCYNSFGLIYAKIASKYSNNIILHAHNCNIDNDIFYLKHIINNIIKFIFNSKKITYIAVSNECNRFCFHNKKTIIIPNGINYEDYCFNNNERIKYRKKFNIKENEIVIGSIGRFEKQKNHKLTINIFNEIYKCNKNYKLILIGDGKLKNKIKKMINKYNLNSQVIIIHNCNDISKLINAFDIYLLPSIYEGFGITIVENEINEKYVFISDRIPKDVIVSNRVNVISLNKKVDYWSNEIINLKEKKFKIDKKLNMNNFISKIENIYRGFDEKNKKI